MKLAHKFTLALVVGILLVHAAGVVIRVQRETALFQDDIAQEGRLLGRALGYAVERAWQTQGERDALDIIDHVSKRESHVNIRWVWLHEVPGQHHAPVVPRDMLAPLLADRSAVISLEAAVYTYVPVKVPGQRIGAIEISDPLVDEQAYLAHSIRNAALTSLSLVLLTSLLAWGLGQGFIGRPVRRLVQQARRVGAGDLGRRLSLRSRDEIGDLAREMDQMCDRLQQARERISTETQARIMALEQLRHADRLTTVGTLASGVAHELGTPINVIDGHAQLIREDTGVSGRVRENAEVISRQCKRMTQIIRQLLDFARRGGPRQGTTDLREVACDTLRMVAPLARKRGVMTALGEDSAGVIAAIGFNEMQQVLMNMLINSLHAMPGGGNLTLRVARVRAAPPGSEQSGATYGCVIVEDTGVGMDEVTRLRIFEPFFTTKDVGEGTGLGLSVAYGIVHDHGGWIEVSSEPGHGTRFAIYLPVEQEA